MTEGKTGTETSASPFYLAKSTDPAGKSIGNGIFAGLDYGAGEQIAALVRPLLASLDTERLQDTCANCYIWTEGTSTGSRLYVKEGTKVSLCAGCKRFRYCSKPCQKEAWNRGHKHECKNLRPVSDKEIPKAVLATMELLIRRKHGLISDQDWQLLSRLDSHIDDFKQNGKYGGIELMAMGTSQFSFTQDTFSKDFVAAMYARVLTNSLTLITPTLDPLGIVLDPTLGHINHSCDPNAYIMMDGAKTSVRSLKPIKKGEEIYISYIDTTNPFSRRQSELSDRWFFTCKCSKCLKGPTQLEDKWIKDVNKLPEKWKAMGENLIKNDDAASDPTNYVGNSVAERRIAAIQGKAFEQYEIAQRASVPKQAINEIEDGMRLCHDTGLWPIHRQPYAALRDDLIVNLLSVGDFRNAWAHCVKRYRDILPKLYPKESHPVRVVQNWQMASLALYLSGEVDSIASGADMGVIAYMLVGEVKQASESSHGEDNAFTKSVRKKFEDMTIELHSNLGAEAGNMIAAQMSQQRQLLIKMGNSVPY